MYTQEDLIEKSSVTITTRCPLIIRKWAIANNVKIPRILWEGYHKMTSNKEDEMTKLNEKVSILADKLTRAQRRIFDMEEQIAGVEKKDENANRK